MTIYPEVERGSTNQTIYIELVDTTAANVPVTGKVAANVTVGLIRHKETSASATMVALASVTSAHVARGFIEIDAVKVPGMYRVDVPNNLLVNDGMSTAIYATFVCAGCKTINICIPLSDTSRNVNIKN